MNNNEIPFNKKNIRAIIGLGNPGQKYYKTRHSIGFRIVDALVDQLGGSWQSSDLMEYTQLQIDGTTVFVIKPLTFMNSSGKVMPFLQKKGIKPDQVLVIHDELEKKYGAISIRLGGSARGHNGLRSIIGVIGDGFWRLRFGIDRPADKNEVGDYVLKPFTLDEEGKMDELIKQGIRLISD